MLKNQTVPYHRMCQWVYQNKFFLPCLMIAEVVNSSTQTFAEQG